MLSDKTLYNYFCYAGKLCVENMKKTKQESVNDLTNANQLDVALQVSNVYDLIIQNVTSIFDKAGLIICQKDAYDVLVKELIDYKFALEKYKEDEDINVFVKFSYVILAGILNNFIIEIIEFKTFSKDVIEECGLSFLIEE